MIGSWWQTDIHTCAGASWFPDPGTVITHWFMCNNRSGQPGCSKNTVCNGQESDGSILTFKDLFQEKQHACFLFFFFFCISIWIKVTVAHSWASGAAGHALYSCCTRLITVSINLCCPEESDHHLKHLTISSIPKQQKIKIKNVFGWRGVNQLKLWVNNHEGKPDGAVNNEGFGIHPNVHLTCEPQGYFC